MVSHPLNGIDVWSDADYEKKLLHLWIANQIFFRSESYVCIATASPAKFPEALEKSGVTYVNPPEIQKLFELEEKFDTMDLGQDWEAILRQKIKLIANA